MISPAPTPSPSIHSAERVSIQSRRMDGRAARRPRRCDCGPDAGTIVLGMRLTPPHLREDERLHLGHPDRRVRDAYLRRLDRARKQEDRDLLTRAGRRRERSRDAQGFSLGGPVSLLEQENNEVEARGVVSTIRVGAVRCKRQVCSCCGRVVGMQARHLMQDRLAELQREHGTEGDVQLWTLTLDRERYASPEAAWLDVGKHRRVGEAMRKMGIKWCVVVLEWHKSGWPHWHVLVWKPEQRMRIDHAEMTKAWGRGHTLYKCRYRDQHGRWRPEPKPMAWAVNYIAGYLTKRDESSMPEWIGNRSRVRMIWASRAWGPVVTKGWECGCESQEGEEGEEPERRVTRSNAEAVADCGSSVRLLRRVVDRATGEERWHYLGVAEVPWRSAKRLVKRLTGVQVAGAGSGVDLSGAASERVLRALCPGVGTIPRPMLS